MKNLSRSESIYLVGYSRGAAAVIEAANSVERPIAAMFLFDAVNRDVRTETDTINSNVGFVYHAVRDPEFARRFEAEARAKQVDLAKKMLTPYFHSPLSIPTMVAGFQAVTATGKDLSHKWLRSRTWFGNTGRKANAPCRYKEKLFQGTHGALGGVPWSDVEGDKDCSRKVGTWMMSCLLATGLRPTTKLTI